MTSSLRKYFFHWYDSDNPAPEHGFNSIDWRHVVELVLVHAGIFGVFWVGVSTTAVIAAVLFYIFRGLCVTTIFHRYFSHKAYQTARVTQYSRFSKIP